MPSSPPFPPLTNIHEFLTALHIYASSAAGGGDTPVRSLHGYHYCAHARADLRQCLIYDSPGADARLIGVEYMVPRSTYLSFPEEEKALWHSHEFEVQSGMLVCPAPEGVGKEEWEAGELAAMREVVGLYGKTWHFWQVDRGDAVPLGVPQLMGSVTGAGQVDLEGALRERDARFGIDYREKAERRRGIEAPGVVKGADAWQRKGEDGKGE